MRIARLLGIDVALLQIRARLCAVSLIEERAVVGEGFRRRRLSPTQISMRITAS